MLTVFWWYTIQTIASNFIALLFIRFCSWFMAANLSIYVQNMALENETREAKPKTSFFFLASIDYRVFFVYDKNALEFESNIVPIRTE